MVDEQRATLAVLNKSSGVVLQSLWGSVDVRLAGATWGAQRSKMCLASPAAPLSCDQYGAAPPGKRHTGLGGCREKHNRVGQRDPVPLAC